MIDTSDIAIRLFKHAIIPFDGGTTCWEWVGTKSRKGYGVLYLARGARIAAHRASMLVFTGKEIPSDLFVCHTCDHPWCVNPYHLFLGDNSDNMRDCAAKKRHHCSRRTHCIKGHPFSGENLRIKKSGARVCVECARIQNAMSYRRTHNAKPRNFRAIRVVKEAQ